MRWFGWGSSFVTLVKAPAVVEPEPGEESLMGDLDLPTLQVDTANRFAFCVFHCLHNTSYLLVS